jgi:thioredoxin 1
MATEFPNVQFETIDVDTSPEETQENFITSVPTVIFFKDGVAKQRFVGAQPKSMYVDTINSLI